MNGKRLLAVILLCASSAIASAQGLVGAPVDPRYGQDVAVAVPGSGAAVKKAGGQHQGTASMVLHALIVALRMVRL